MQYRKRLFEKHSCRSDGRRLRGLCNCGLASAPGGDVGCWVCSRVCSLSPVPWLWSRPALIWGSCATCMRLVWKKAVSLGAFCLCSGVTFELSSLPELHRARACTWLCALLTLTLPLLGFLASPRTCLIIQTCLVTAGLRLTLVNATGPALLAQRLWDRVACLWGPCLPCFAPGPRLSSRAEVLLLPGMFWGLFSLLRINCCPVGLSVYENGQVCVGGWTCGNMWRGIILMGY